MPRPPNPDADPRRTGKWQALRLLILARDGGVCVWCASAPATCVDHVQPLAAGGAPYDPANLVAACLRCNSIRGARQGAPRPKRITRKKLRNVTGSAFPSRGTDPELPSVPDPPTPKIDPGFVTQSDRTGRAQDGAQGASLPAASGRSEAMTAAALSMWRPAP